MFISEQKLFVDSLIPSHALSTMSQANFVPGFANELTE